MEEKTTMEITNDRLEGGDQRLRNRPDKRKAYSSLKSASSDETVSSGNVKSTRSANTLLLKSGAGEQYFVVYTSKEQMANAPKAGHS